MLNINGKLIQSLSRSVDYIVLNLLTILCSIPILTAGAARAALLDCMKKLRMDLDTHLVRNYFEAFRREFGGATRMWLIYLLLAGWMLADIYAMRILNLGTASFVLTVVFAILLVLITMAYVCGFGLNSFFENTAKKNFMNGLIIGVGNFPTVFFLALLEVLPLAVIWFIPPSIGYVVIIYSMLGFSLITKMELSVYLQIFRRYLPEGWDAEPDHESEEGEGAFDETEATFDFRSLTDYGNDPAGAHSEAGKTEE